MANCHIKNQPTSISKLDGRYLVFRHYSYYYRSKNNLECDAVVHLRNGSYGLIEIKIGGADLIEDGTDSLKTLSDKIDTTKMKKPSFLMVLTGIGDYAYKRLEDGVLVVPIGCLKS